MEIDRLLAITPDALAKAILHRRERLAEVIPEQLDARREEKVLAEEFARDARANKDELTSQSIKVKAKRDSIQAEARDLYFRSNDIRIKFEKNQDEWTKSSIEHRFSLLEHRLNLLWSMGDHKRNIHDEMKEIVQSNIEWSNAIDLEDDVKNEMVELCNASIQHISQSEEIHFEYEMLIEQQEKLIGDYQTKELNRRKLDSKTKQLSLALQRSEEGIEHWRQICNGDFNHLLVNAEEVKNGALSTHAHRLQSRRNQNNSNRGDE